MFGSYHQCFPVVGFLMKLESSMWAQKGLNDISPRLLFPLKVCVTPSCGEPRDKERQFEARVNHSAHLLSLMISPKRGYSVSNILAQTGHRNPWVPVD
ncbi:hypothetical protein RRG08_002191 [Elysia crispata]|uniref:Uncharacterized protein n=1 Tax=Elysia crispata TaxID=231223 RepID=A0AAE1DD15_9GAST|nr:hypothetical protein RRG08_002191 [Elysia crispata]